MKRVDLSGRKIITGRDVEDAARTGAIEIVVQKRAILHSSARDMLQKLGIALRFGSEVKPIADPRVESCFYSPEADAIKDEICSVGCKLWQRSYVDGNGGNVSYRIGENEVICTPTMLSKADLTPDDLCLIDLEGNQLAGNRRRTSEALLHLEIYRTTSRAKAVIHCHPPHATAYAVSGQIPPTGIIPEFDVFVGSVALTQYETPGTRAFAESVRPYAQDHNTILLGNHGIVCWADTPTHAEWNVEVLETYCRTLLLSRQLGGVPAEIPLSKQQELLDIRRRLGIIHEGHEDTPIR